MNDLASIFAQELEAVGGVVHRVANRDEAAGIVRDLLTERGAQSVVRTPRFDLDLGDNFDALYIGGENGLDRDEQRRLVFAADAGLTTVDWAVADTGSLVLLAGAENERSVSLLPPIHIALLYEEHIRPDLGDLFELINDPPSALTLITGPSRTGDIELKLTVGVHGPGELHVVLLA